MLKAYVKSDIPARSIQRISTALADYAPQCVEIVQNTQMADFVVHIVVGVQNFADIPIDKLIENEIAHDQRYAIVQCCIMSTEQNVPDFWKPLWSQADVVWSYLDLMAFAPTYDFPFYYAPLGVDSSVFNRNAKRERDITMLTTGYVTDTECIRESAEAARRVGGKHLQVGPDFHLGPHSSAKMDVTDFEMASLYSRSQFVAGLRRDEGFELPAAEGLLCGARPIMFDAPHYRKWFDKWAVFIPEECASLVTSSIEEILKKEMPVSDKEYEEARAAFDWSRIIGDFWGRIVSIEDTKK